MRDFFEPQNGTDIVIHSGFPNAAADSRLGSLSLDRLLVKQPSSTFLMRISGNEWQSRGVFDGDLLVIDRGINPRPNDTVVWWHESTFAISYCKHLPADSTIWGIVTYMIHKART